MSKRTIAVLDYEVGNLKSIISAIDYLGAKVICSQNIDDFLYTDALIIPGVGAYLQGIDTIKKHNYDQFIAFYKSSGRPILGICLGMQLLLSDSSEFGLTKGLNIIPGVVRKLSDDDFGGSKLRLPHVGWAKLRFREDRTTLENKLLVNISEENYFYFVHSYAGITLPEYSLAYTKYQSIQFASIVSDENVIGVQFHPEKSGEVGLAMLSNFINL